VQWVCSQGRKALVAELIELNGIVKVLEWVPAEIDDWHVLREELSRSGGEDDLAAVCRFRDPRCQMHVEPDVVAVCDEWLACVQSHSYPDWARPETHLSLGCRSESVHRGLKDDEEGISLRAHLEAAVPGERFAKDASVLRKSRDVTLTELTQEHCRAFYVSEE
jgi:hypothetical protein